MRKNFALILVLVILLGTLTGCDSADYKKAVSLYQSGKYAEAIKLFEGVGDYKDSQMLLMDCRFEYAKVLLEDGDYVNAREQLLHLEQTAEVEQYLYQTAWGIVRTYLEENGTFVEKNTKYDTRNDSEREDYCEISAQGKAVSVNIRSNEIKNMGFDIRYNMITNASVSFDGKEMKPQLEAKSEHFFSFSLKPFYNVGTCIWDIALYTADMPVEWIENTHISEDGKMYSDRNAPALDESVIKQRNFIAESLVKLLKEANLGLTMADLGFVNY